MALLIHKLKTLNTKKALSAAILGGMLAFSLSFIPASALGPQFNIFPISYIGELNHDLPLLDGRNASLGEGWSVSQADHDAGVQANPGNVLEFSVYYHNGAADDDANVAINTVIQAFANPSLGNQAASHVISATIGAQNSSTVSSADSSRGGNITVFIQGGQTASLSLVPGSVKWFPTQGQTPPGSPVTMPDTIFAGGVNIGNVRGCFQYHGFVNFKVQVSQVKSLSVSLSKTVRNVTKNTTFAKQVNADPNDEIQFKLVGTNTGQDVIWHMFFKDILPTGLTYISGSLVSSQPIVSGDLFSSGGLDAGQANIGQSVTLTFRAKVADASQFSAGTTVLTNAATHWGFGPPTPTRTTDVTDTAQVIVTKQQQIVTCTFTWSQPLVSDGSNRGLRHTDDHFNVQEYITGLAPFTNFNIVHQQVSGTPTFRTLHTADQSGGWNVFNGSIILSTYTPGDYNAYVEVSGVFVATCLGFRVELPTVQQISLDKTVGGTSFADQIDAQPAQRVTFKLVISPLGSNQALANVTLRDTLPSKLTFVSGTFNVNGIVQGEDGFFGSGINLGSLQPSSQITVTFQADVASASNFTVGQCEILVNTGMVTSGSLNSSDTATVRVCKQAAVKQPGSPSPRPLN